MERETLLSLHTHTKRYRNWKNVESRFKWTHSPNGYNQQMVIQSTNGTAVFHHHFALPVRTTRMGFFLNFFKSSNAWERQSAHFHLQSTCRCECIRHYLGKTINQQKSQRFLQNAIPVSWCHTFLFQIKIC